MILFLLQVRENYPRYVSKSRDYEDDDTPDSLQLTTKRNFRKSRDVPSIDSYNSPRSRDIRDPRDSIDNSRAITSPRSARGTGRYDPYVSETSPQRGNHGNYASQRGNHGNYASRPSFSSGNHGNYASRPSFSSAYKKSSVLGVVGNMEDIFPSSSTRRRAKPSSLHMSAQHPGYQPRPKTNPMPTSF